jgi:pimeloyl-ACP methyl ester carboxylesterase
MVAGAGTQLTWWPPGLLHAVAVAGHHVAVFDHRDTGRSSRLTGAVSFPAVRRALAAGTTPALPYGLADLAGDVVAVMDAIGAATAHVVGVSMGGMVAQETAIRHPERVRSLVSIMASTGTPGVGGATAAAEATLYRAPPPGRKGAVAARLAALQVVATPGTVDEEAERGRAAWEYDRGFNPAGAGRHLAAVLAASDRTAALRTLDVPTLVIHGDADPLIDVSGGRATAAAVPGATYAEIPGMAHDLPDRHLVAVLRPLLRHLATS